MKKIISIISILFTFSLISYADFETGNSLLLKLEYFSGYDVNKLGEIEYLNLIHASGYVIGVFDAYNELYYEGPSGVTTNQIVDIAKKYLEAHPETRHVSAIFLLKEAFKEAFPKK